MTHAPEIKTAIQFLAMVLAISIACLLLWQFPFIQSTTYALDIKVFETLNGLLSRSELLQTIFGILNHKKETKLNLVFMALVNLYCVFTQPKSQRLPVLFHILFFWAFFELGFMYQDWYFIEHLGIRRESPTLVLAPVFLLSEALGNPLIKDTSDCCFPSGHASAILFWYGFSVLYMPRHIKRLMTPIVILFLFPRVFSGAHWFSDILFSCGLAASWLGVGFLVHAVICRHLPMRA